MADSEAKKQAQIKMIKEQILAKQQNVEYSVPKSFNKYKPLPPFKGKSSYSESSDHSSDIDNISASEMRDIIDKEKKEIAMKK